ncbi:AI-2E family transporter [Microbacterium amylolyticum]|uniref:PurR-regulated permease PerM n=1 Tax=Microbacterium amylolyticum TaxID=936337 RepID=A0ABS4ZI70_9MICO|nr:AI-2E family transporter [Microbacterium amylolyticum]MBP2436695.1 putative PurR-regulated permease PerM [Microbacterium amylolyticum]
MTPERTAGPAMPPVIRVLVVVAAVIAVLAGLWVTRGIFGPLALAAIIVIICYPIGPAIVKRGAPRWAGATAVILLSYLVLAVLAALMTWAIMEFIRLVTDLAPEFTRMTQDVYAWMVDLGVEAVIGSEVTSIFSASNIIGYVTALSSSAFSITIAFFFVLAYVIFMGVDSARYARAEEAFGARVRPILQRMRAYCSSVRRYFVVNASFGFVTAIIDGVALYLLDIPAPVVWAILSFVTNFIPNIGFVLGVAPPAILALVVGDWVTMVAVLAIYCVANVTLQVLIQPKFISDAVGLSLTLSFFSVIFWTTVLGPLGAILSIPLTLLGRALILESDPSTSWLRWLSGDEQAADSPLKPRSRWA